MPPAYNSEERPGNLEGINGNDPSQPVIGYEESPLAAVVPVDLTYLGRPQDIAIAVMGVTGVGKSTFISYFSKTAAVGEGLESCRLNVHRSLVYGEEGLTTHSGTTKVGIHAARIGDRKIYLIDTPGFDDTHRSDADVLREVADWLNESYKTQVKLAGIIYLHRIQDNRVGGSGLKNLRMFKKLCGEEGLSCVVLATTMWNTDSLQKSEQRERELQTKEEFWAGLIRKGSKVFRQDQGAESARKIIEHILSLRNRMTLKIQVEMASGKTLDETGAGREVQSDMEQLKKKHEKELQQLRQEMLEAQREHDVQGQREIAAIRTELVERMKKEQAEREKLRVNAEQLRKERDEELRKERENSHRKELEHQKTIWQTRWELERQIDKNQYEARLMEYRFKQQSTEAELQRLKEKEASDCILM